MWTALLAMTLCSPPAAGADGAPWKDDGVKDGVQIWYRDVPTAREVHAETTIAAKPQRVWEVLQGIEHYVEFMPYLAEIKKIGECDGGIVVYERVEPPLIEARDYAICIRMAEDSAAGVWRRWWDLANDKMPPRAGTVRVVVNRGEWVLRSDGNGGTRLEYTLATNPGGAIPQWIAKRANVSSLPGLLNAVRHRSIDPGWKR